MRAVLQRVSQAAVRVDGAVVGEIATGLLVLVGVADGDTDTDADQLATKIAELRLFPLEGEPDGMERSLTEVGGAALIVSQFTLLGDCRKGRRPSWSSAARPDDARHLYERVIAGVQARGIPTATGAFRTVMQVELVNSGPVTLLLDTKKAF